MLLKEVYDRKFLENLAQIAARYDKKFDAKKFLDIPQKNWQPLELKERMRFISLRLHEFLLHKSYEDQLEIIKKIAAEFPKSKHASLALIALCDFVEIAGAGRGLATPTETFMPKGRTKTSMNVSDGVGTPRPALDFTLSMQTLEFLTEFGTAEFAVRHFIKLDEKAALKFFIKWAKSKNHHLRRLASEGLRPRLPWGCALESFKKNPTPILSILEQLKLDNSEYVRRSVANNLNDISKDNPQVVLNLLQKWRDEGVSEKLIKHALRTLLKKGDKAALALIGIDHSKSSKNFAIQNFSLQNPVIKNRAELAFDFTLHSKAETLIRLEYAVYFLRNNGSHSKKIFQITTKNFTEGVFYFSKKHSFREITTRKYYVGEHMISLVVNGFELPFLTFDLV